MAATYTVLSNSVKKNQSEVVIEFAVPATNNTANVGWQNVVSQLRTAAGETGTRNPLKAADTAYVAQLDSGALMELTLTVEYDANLSDPAKVTFIENAVAGKVAEFTAEFVSLYEFYGFTGVV